uniref:G_PROTEIN_RECEP_F1_2 domain-containing protein n=1 Tax=Macrostomum lignano TaxID=282301 RepID=A0A1I8FCD8_9PLAT
SARPYNLCQQTVCIKSISFRTKSIVGYTELLLQPLTPQLRKVKLNCKQCTVYSIWLETLPDSRGHQQTAMEASFAFNDPTMEICRAEMKQRNLAFFEQRHELAVGPPAAHHSGILSAAAASRPVTSARLWAKMAKLTCAAPTASPRLRATQPGLWLPCIDSCSELCQWRLEITVPEDMVAVARRRPHSRPTCNPRLNRYFLAQPTCAPNIGFAIGAFELETGGRLCPALPPLIFHTVSRLPDCLAFYESLLGVRLPYGSLKLVFVDQAYETVQSYASVILASVSLLHLARIVDQAIGVRRARWHWRWRSSFWWMSQMCHYDTRHEVLLDSAALPDRTKIGRDSVLFALPSDVPPDYAASIGAKLAGYPASRLQAGEEYLLDQWVTQPRHARLRASFSINKKRNLIALEIRDDPPVARHLVAAEAAAAVAGATRGAWRLQELDGPFTHTLKLDESAAVSDLPCHTKSRKIKRRKTNWKIRIWRKLESDCSLLWLRVDPEMQLIRHVEIVQPEPMWHLLLRYERCVASQMARLQGPLPALFHSRETWQALMETSASTIESACRPAYALCMISGPLDLLEPLMAVFLSLFRAKDTRGASVHVAALHTAQGVCPPEVPEFILNLLRFNDNSKNIYADDYYRAALIESLFRTVSPAATVTTENFLAKLPKLLLRCWREVMRHMNLEKLMPQLSAWLVTVKCLRVFRKLQRTGYIPPDIGIFKSYAAPGNYIDVRLAAMEGRGESYQVRQGRAALAWLLDSTVCNPAEEASVRHQAVAMLTIQPPFLRRKRGQLDTPELVERLWRLLNTELSADCRLRCSVASSYHLLYGRHRPKCTPLRGELPGAQRRTKIAQRAPTPPPAPADTDRRQRQLWPHWRRRVGLCSSGDEADVDDDLDIGLEDDYEARTGTSSGTRSTATPQPLGAAREPSFLAFLCAADAAQCLLCLLSLLLNSLSYLALGRDGSDSTLAMQLRSLAVTDTLPAPAGDSRLFLLPIFGHPIVWGIRVAFITLHNWLMLFMAAVRFAKIRWPLRANANLWFSRRRTRNWMGAIWIVAMATSLVRGLEVTSVLADCPDRVQPDGRRRFAHLPGTVTPVVAVMVVNVLLLRTVRRSNNFQRDAAGGGSSPNSTIAVSTVSMASSGGARQLAASSSDVSGKKPGGAEAGEAVRQLTRMVTLLMYMYLICQTPMVLYG